MANLVNTIRGMFAPLVEEKKIVSEAPEDKEPASPDEAKMAMKQLEFIEYAAEELMDHIESGKEFPEWMQNKLSKLHGQMESLHSALGDHGEEDEDEMEEQVAVAPVPGDKWKSHAVMVNTKVTRNGKPQRVVIDRKNIKNYPAKDGWKEVSPGMKEEAVQSEESNDEHFSKQSKKMQDAINLHLRKGKSYQQAVAAAKVHVKEEAEIEEGYVVKYHTAKGEHKNTSKVFDNEAAAKSHAARGNSVDKVGGKYTVHKIGSKGHEVKEEVELDEAPLPRVGMKVHAGMGTKGGAGVTGKVVQVAGGYVYIKNAEGKTYKAPMKNVTIEESAELEEAKMPSADAINKVLGPTKNSKEGLAALMKAFKVDEKGAKAMLQKALGEEADLEEGWEDMMKAAAERRKPQPNGGAGKKAGRAYGGANQKDDKQKNEALTPKQKQLDVDKDGDIEADDLKALRDKKKKVGSSGKAEPVEINPKMNEGMKPGWMLKKDPELAKKVKANQELAKKRQASYGDKSAGKSMGEETDFLNELLEASEMSDAEMKKREDIVKSMKKKTADFKSRYGDRWKSVMYATATKMANK